MNLVREGPKKSNPQSDPLTFPDQVALPIHARVSRFPRNTCASHNARFTSNPMGFLRDFFKENQQEFEIGMLHVTM